MNRRTVLAGSISLGAVLTPLLSGCGFRLRGSTALPFDSIFIDAPASSSIAPDLKRFITTLGSDSNTTKILPSADGAKVILRIIREQREKEVTGVTASGKQRDYQLRLRLVYQALKSNFEPLTPETELVLRRDISSLDSQLSSKLEEDILLYREMQNDLAQQLMSRLAALKSGL